MSPILRAGVSIVLVALACYTVGVLKVQRQRLVSAAALRFLFAGVFFDVTATVCMIIGSGRLVTLHGIIGYSALVAMLVDTWLVSRHRARHGDAAVTDGLLRYTRLAYAWWVIAFITGGMLAAMNRS